MTENATPGKQGGQSEKIRVPACAGMTKYYQGMGKDYFGLFFGVVFARHCSACSVLPQAS